MVLYELKFFLEEIKMIRKIKTTALILSFALVFCGVCGCGKEEAPVEAEESFEEIADEETGEYVDEEADEYEDEEFAVNEFALRGPSYSGLTNLYEESYEDGTFYYEDMTDDGLTVITNVCGYNMMTEEQELDDYVKTFVGEVVDNDANVTDVVDDETVSTTLTYPTYRVYWEAGSNEDTRQNVGVVALTDYFTFYYGYGCPIDYYEENADTYESDLDSVEWADLADLEAERANISDSADVAGGDGSGFDYYADKIEELKAEGLADQFTLAFINDDGDDIPELIASDSKGSFDHENAFIFTIYNDEVVEVASAIAGVDGANLDYAIGANLIHISGAAAGMRDVFARIENGKLEEVFVAEASSMEDDAKYSINGESVKKDDYYKQINDFMRPYNPLVRIAYDGLYDVTYTYSDGNGGFEQGSMEPYSR